jgi:CPA2 family monovalent cation:H+ antiporter-2
MLLILTSFASKFLIITAILTKAKGYDDTTALRTGLGMASARGELSLIIAKAGQDIGAITSTVFPILGIVTIVTAFMTPYVIKFGNILRISQSVTSPDTATGEKTRKFRFHFRS